MGREARQNYGLRRGPLTREKTTSVVIDESSLTPDQRTQINIPSMNLGDEVPFLFLPFEIDLDYGQLMAFDRGAMRASGGNSYARRSPICERQLTTGVTDELFLRDYGEGQCQPAVVVHQRDGFRAKVFTWALRVSPSGSHTARARPPVSLHPGGRSTPFLWCSSNAQPAWTSVTRGRWPEVFLRWSWVQSLINLGRTDSPIEERFYSRLRDVSFPLCGLLTPQVSIGPYRVDFAYFHGRMVVECDGHEWHSTKEARTRDAERDRYLMKEGWKVIRVTGSEIHSNLDKCIRDIEEIFDTHSTSETQEWGDREVFPWICRLAEVVT